MSRPPKHSERKAGFAGSGGGPWRFGKLSPSTQYKHPLVLATSAAIGEIILKCRENGLKSIEGQFLGAGPLAIRARNGRALVGVGAGRGQPTLKVSLMLGEVDWVLRWHEQLFAALLAHGVEAVGGVGENERVQLVGFGVRSNISMLEDNELWAEKPGAFYGVVRAYVSVGTFRFRATRRTGQDLVWKGTPAELSKHLPVVVAELVALLQESARREREEAEATRDRESKLDGWIATRERYYAQQRAPSEQKARLDDVLARRQKFAGYMDLLGEMVNSKHAEAGVRAWAALVKSAVADPLGELVEQIEREFAADAKPPWVLACTNPTTAPPDLER